MYYYSKENDIFYHCVRAMLELNKEIRELNPSIDYKDLDEESAPNVVLNDDIVTYTDEQYKELFSKRDLFHTIAQDEVTKLPVQKELSDEIKISRIRKKRERDCFPVINRGSAWYALLTDAQKTELNEWYQAWLDAPETLTIPTTPSWV